VSKLAELIGMACGASGLRAEAGFRLALPDGHELPTVVRIAELGAPNGMLLFHTFREMKAYADVLGDLGFGFAVIREPRRDARFDLNSYRTMFRDWDWSGSPESKPDWM